MIASSGTNDVAAYVTAHPGYTSAQIAALVLADIAALIDVIKAACPSASVVWWSLPPMPNATHNAARLLVVAGLAAIVAARPLCSYVDAGSLLDTNVFKGKSDSPAFTHPDQRGYRLLAVAIWQHVRENVLGSPTYGLPWPRGYLLRTAQAATSFDGSATARVYWSGPNADLDPGVGNWSVSFAFRLATLPSGLHSFFGYGSDVANQILICQTTSGACSVYYSGSLVLSAIPHCFTAASWGTFVLVYDATAQTLSLWINGVLRKVATGLAVMAHPTGQTVTSIGANVVSGTSAIDGLMIDFAMSRGANVPGWYTSTGSAGGDLRRFAEAHNRGLQYPAGCVAHYPLSTEASPSASDIGNADSSAWGVGVATSAAGTVPTPWDEVSG